jgi:mannitol/fructose-specific phosphotransferase system IIA component (Ntr-type)
MKLTDHLPPQLVKVPLLAKDKTAAITELVDLMISHGVSDDREQLLAAVLERESQRTTGIGRGFAIPHAKTDAVGRLVIALGRPAAPLDFGAIDGQPVRLIALLASPTKATSIHIQALAKLSRLVTNAAVMESLLSAASADRLHQIIADNDVNSQ